MSFNRTHIGLIMKSYVELSVYTFMNIFLCETANKAKSESTFLWIMIYFLNTSISWMQREVTFTITFLTQRRQPPYINFQKLKGRSRLSLKTNIKITNTSEWKPSNQREFACSFSFPPAFPDPRGARGSVDSAPLICYWGMPLVWCHLLSKEKIPAPHWYPEMAKWSGLSKNSTKLFKREIS